MVEFAELTCVLKVNSRCQACKMQMMEVMGAITGRYTINLDASGGLVKISAEVEPDRALGALAKTGKHAEVVWSKINHPQVNRTRHNDMNNSLNYNMGGYNLGYGNYCGALENPYYSNRTYGNRQLPGYGNYYDAVENPYHSNRTYGNRQVPGYDNYRPFYPFYPTGMDGSYLPYY